MERWPQRSLTDSIPRGRTACLAVRPHPVPSDPDLREGTMTTELTPAQLFAEFLPTDWVYIPNLDGHVGWAYRSGDASTSGTLTICYKPAIDTLATEPRHPEATFEFVDGGFVADGQGPGRARIAG